MQLNHDNELFNWIFGCHYNNCGYIVQWRKITGQTTITCDRNYGIVATFSGWPINPGNVLAKLPTLLTFS